MHGAIAGCRCHGRRHGDRRTRSSALQRLVVLDVAEFPVMRHWFVVHRKGKRLSAVAEAFKQFMLNESAALMDKEPHGPSRNKKR